MLPTSDPSSLLDSGEWVKLPPLIDAHVHLDKTLFGSRWVPHHESPVLRERIDHEQHVLDAQPDDLRTRAGRLLQRLSSRGVTGIRAQVDVTDATGLTNLTRVLELKQQWADRMAFDVVAFPQAGILSQTHAARLMREGLELGADTVGGLDPEGFDGDRGGQLAAVFDLATTFGSRIDIHLHERGLPGDVTLREIAARTRDNGLGGRVAVSHAFSLADLARTDISRLAVTAEMLAEADVSIHTSLPEVEVLPPVPALLAAGVNVAVVSDNIRDSWSPYGKGDALERANLAGLLFAWRRDEDLTRALDLVTTAPARSTGLGDFTTGDYVLVRAGSVGEAIVDQPPDRVVVRAGCVVSGSQHLDA
ncbi:amidohydrolase family protein [Naasia lichenicola]|uniref:Metal-dependent hydrolase n=1 Tax=Naasia lichenicola TaxID=2565933 RepID=A0A4S4FJ26_9MICO|nr:amidohydrolase family protein [Naasia lichenicola]THG30088.1 metal-dependent hydrolase [Naasia lichenicola]